MQRWLQRNWNEHGEGSMRDVLLGYRICNFNGHAHEGVHVHHEDSQTLEPMDLDLSEEDALHVVYRYHERAKTFDLASLTEVASEWRSQ